jgi:hypothetical protein
VQGNNHKAKAEQKANTKQTSLTQPVSGKRNQSYSDMCIAIVAANIPSNAMEYPSQHYEKVT